MVRKGQKRALILILLTASAILWASSPHPGPQAEDAQANMVRLIKAGSVQLLTGEDEKSFRKATDATFLHNDTYLICDTAIWRVEENIINAIGHVRLTQEGTKLTSETLDYYVDRDLAEFRGGVVQLEDNDGNILRTRHLDYNTADSVAVFANGGALKDKDGQIIESIDGTYDSKASLFTFHREVNMFTDSIFIRTNSLKYRTDLQKAFFDSDIDFWKDDNMLSASRGWYDRPSETFFFTGKVHATSANHETWSDSLFFYRLPSDVLLLGNVQLQDSLHRTSAVAGKLLYVDSLSRVTLTRDAAVAIAEEKGQAPDTLYFGADTLIYYTLRRCDIPEGEVKAAEERIAEMLTDAVGSYRERAAKEAAEKAAKQKEENEARKAGARGGAPKGTPNPGQEKDNAPVPPQDQGQAPAMEEDAPMPPQPQMPDSSAVSSPADSSAVTVLDQSPDSLAVMPPPDTTKIGFVMGLRNVKVFRSDIQVVCDSLRYTDLDSIARFYINPLVWNEENRQYYSDSLNVLVRDGGVDRASLMSNAMIVTKEDSLLFDQISGAEVIAYFDSTSALKRFDAVGGATAIFYLEENGTYATVNKVSSKMLSGSFRDGTLDRVHYFESPKNDAYPVAQFPAGDRYLKGFLWRPELRPEGKSSITDMTVRPSERAAYEAHPTAEFRETEIYFPGYMQGVYDSIREEKAAKERRERKREPIAEDMALSRPDSLELRDTLAAELAPVDSIAVADSVMVQKDTLAVSDSLSALSSQEPLTFKDKIRAWKRKAELRRQAREEARERRWELLDARDAERKAEKERKALEKARAKKRREIEALREEERQDREKLNHYIEYYELKKAREENKTKADGTD